MTDPFLGLLFALAAIATALVEARRWSAEAQTRERVAVLEEKMELAERWRESFRGRVDALEEAARQDPHRRRK